MTTGTQTKMNTCSITVPKFQMKSLIFQLHVGIQVGHTPALGDTTLGRGVLDTATRVLTTISPVPMRSQTKR
jgi:hypothetical protein